MKTDTRRSVPGFRDLATENLYVRYVAEDAQLTKVKRLTVRRAIHCIIFKISSQPVLIIWSKPLTFDRNRHEDPVTKMSLETKRIVNTRWIYILYGGESALQSTHISLEFDWNNLDDLINALKSHRAGSCLYCTVFAVSRQIRCRLANFAQEGAAAATWCFKSHWIFANGLNRLPEVPLFAVNSDRPEWKNFIRNLFK